MSNRIKYKIERSNKTTSDRMKFNSKEDGIELTCHISKQCNTNNVPELKENYVLSFQFDIDYLASFGNPSVLILDKKETELCCNAKLIVSEILKTKYTGHLKNMLIEAKAIELFLCVVGCELEIEDKCGSCTFLTNQYEKEKIYAAKEILLNNLAYPPIISELSLQVGINQCYLKKGFKDIFGTTIYAFVQEQRIIKAKLLLKTTNSSVSDIAEMVGFSNASNFSNAFKNYTGISPSELRNN